MAHENGDEQRQTKSRHVQGMLDETDPLTISKSIIIVVVAVAGEILYPVGSLMNKKE